MAYGADEHTFNEIMGIAFDYGTIHKCAGIAFIGVAYEIFFIRNRLSRRVPFKPGGESRTAASRKAGDLYDVDDLLGRKLAHRLFNGLISADGNVFVDACGIDYAAVAQRNAGLSVEKGFILGRYLKIVETFEIAGIYGVCDSFGIVGLDLYKAFFKCLSVVDVNDGLGKAHTDTSCGMYVIAKLFEAGIEPRRAPAAIPQLPCPTAILICHRPFLLNPL